MRRATNKRGIDELLGEIQVCRWKNNCSLLGLYAQHSSSLQITIEALNGEAETLRTQLTSSTPMPDRKTIKKRARANAKLRDELTGRTLVLRRLAPTSSAVEQTLDSLASTSSLSSTAAASPSKITAEQRARIIQKVDREIAILQRPEHSSAFNADPLVDTYRRLLETMIVQVRDNTGGQVV